MFEPGEALRYVSLYLLVGKRTVVPEKMVLYALLRYTHIHTHTHTDTQMLTCTRTSRGQASTPLP